MRRMLHVVVAMFGMGAAVPAMANIPAPRFETNGFVYLYQAQAAETVPAQQSKRIPGPPPVRLKADRGQVSMRDSGQSPSTAADKAAAAF